MRKIFHLAKYFSSMNSSATRITKGMAAFSLSQLINFFVRIGLPPLYLHAWGIHVYGDWLIVYSVAAYLSLSGLGGQTYVINRLSQLFSQQNETEYKKVFNSGLLWFALFTIFIFFLFIIVIQMVPITSIIHTSNISPTSVKLILSILAFEILLSVPQGLLTGVYQSVGKLPFGIMLLNVMTFFQLLFCGVALYMKATPVTVAMLHTLPLIFYVMFMIFHIRSLFSFPIFSLKSANLQLAKSFAKPSFNFLAIELSTAFSVQGIIIILGGILSSVQLVMFATMRTVINMMKQVLGIISNASRREMTHYDAIEDQRKQRLLFRSILRTSLIAAVMLASVLYFFAGTLYVLWLHNRVPFQQPLMNLFLLYGIEMVFWTACANLLISTNRHHVLARIYLISGAISLLAAYIGGHYFGIDGVVLALLIVDLALPAWFIPYLLYRYDSHFNLSFFVRELSPVLLAVLLIPIVPISTALVLPLLLYWWYRGLPLDVIKKHLGTN